MFFLQTKRNAHWKERQKMDRKKTSTDRYKEMQKIKYKPIELETSLKLKIEKTLMLFSQDSLNRGYMTQQKGLKLMIDLYVMHLNDLSEKSMKLKEWLCVSIARICISIPPISIDSNIHKSIVLCLIFLIKNATHQLFQYEALLAVCNFAATQTKDDINDIRKYMIEQGLWDHMRECLSDDNPFDINAAALECYCNLIHCQTGFLIFFFCLFCLFFCVCHSAFLQTKKTKMTIKMDKKKGLKKC